MEPWQDMEIAFLGETGRRGAENAGEEKEDRGEIQ
jgi:hypothetical protein